MAARLSPCCHLHFLPCLVTHQASPSPSSHPFSRSSIQLKKRKRAVPTTYMYTSLARPSHNKEQYRNYSIVLKNCIGYSSASDSDKCVQMKPSYFWTNPKTDGRQKRPEKRLLPSSAPGVGGREAAFFCIEQSSSRACCYAGPCGGTGHQ